MAPENSYINTHRGTPNPRKELRPRGALGRKEHGLQGSRGKGRKVSKRLASGNYNTLGGGYKYAPKR